MPIIGETINPLRGIHYSMALYISIGYYTIKIFFRSNT